jgi:hypothetical protein
VDLVQKDQTTDNSIRVRPIPGPYKAVINANKLGEESDAVKATNTLLPGKHYR